MRKRVVFVCCNNLIPAFKSMIVKIVISVLSAAKTLADSGHMIEPDTAVQCTGSAVQALPGSALHYSDVQCTTVMCSAVTE